MFRINRMESKPAKVIERQFRDSKVVDDELRFRNEKRDILLSLDDDGLLVLGKEGDERRVACVEVVEGNTFSMPLMVYDRQTKTLRATRYLLDTQGNIIGLATKEELKNKVDKVEGKELSANDYTDVDKELVNDLRDKVFVERLVLNGKTYEGAEVIIPINDLLVVSGGGVAMVDRDCEAGDGGMAGGEQSESGRNGLAWGHKSEAKFARSFAFGTHIETTAEGQIVVGLNNERDSSKVFAVGNGSHENPSTAFSVGFDGRVWVGNEELVPRSWVKGELLALSQRIEQLQTEIGAAGFAAEADPSSGATIEEVEEVEDE